MPRFTLGAGALAAFLLTGSPADPSPLQQQQRPAVSSAIDSGVRTIRGYNARTETPVAGDGEFLRRVMLDLVGYPPNAEQVKAFLADPSAGKRSRMIDALLDSEHWAEFWSRRFAEVFFGNYHDVTMDTQPALSKKARDRSISPTVSET